MALVKRDAESDLDLPTGHPHVFNDQSKQLLALFEVQVVEVGHNALREAEDALTQPIVVDQLLPLGNQLVAFHGQAPPALVDLPCPNLELRRLKEAGLIHVDEPAPLQIRRLESAGEPAELSGEQLVIGRRRATGQGGLSSEQHVWSKDRLAHLCKNERVKFVSTDSMLPAAEVITSGAQWIAVGADVVADHAARTTSSPADGPLAIGDEATSSTAHQAPQQPDARFGAPRAEPGVVVADVLHGIEDFLAHDGRHRDSNPFRLRPLTLLGFVAGVGR